MVIYLLEVDVADHALVQNFRSLTDATAYAARYELRNQLFSCSSSWTRLLRWRPTWGVSTTDRATGKMIYAQVTELDLMDL